MLEITTTYNFKLVAGGREYNFNIKSTSPEKAKEILVSDLKEVTQELSK